MKSAQHCTKSGAVVIMWEKRGDVCYFGFQTDGEMFSSGKFRNKTPASENDFSTISQLLKMLWENPGENSTPWEEMRGTGMEYHLNAMEEVIELYNQKLKSL